MVGDPQASTDVQRSWLYSKDPSVAAAKIGKTKYKFEKDNETSLPIGEGEHAKFSHSSEPGFYRCIKSDITNYKNNIISKK